MKKILSILTVAVIFTACKSKTDSTLSTSKNMVLVDTTGLSQSNVLTDVGNNKYVINDKAVTTPVTNKPVVVKPVAASPQKTTTVNNSGSNNSGGGSGNNTPATTAEAPVKQDKGWSDAAKGTAIGAGSGAVLGAVIAKDDRGKGAVIGSVIGAGAGYIIGRHRDKKSGRVARARARRRARH